MEKLRAEVRVISSGFDSVDAITDFLVETSGLPREKILEIQAENDAEWKSKYGATAKEMEEIKKHIRFMRIREYSSLVICGDLAKEKAAKHLHMSLDEFESWIKTWQFIDNCLME